MGKGKNHKRFKNFSIQVCTEKRSGSQIGMILFANDYKFRSHAVKHLTNTIEFENVWKQELPKGTNSLSGIISELETIDCLYLKLRTETPPCHKCGVFSGCTRIVKGLETAYLEVMTQIISNIGNLPRYAMFDSARINKKVFSALTDNKVTLKGCKAEDDLFNIMTCYAKSSSSLNQIIKNETSKILIESENKSVSWCNELNWGIGLNIGDKKNNKPVKKKKPKKPYRRSGAGNWKQYLDEIEDW